MTTLPILFEAVAVAPDGESTLARGADFRELSRSVANVTPGLEGPVSAYVIRDVRTGHDLQIFALGADGRPLEDAPHLRAERAILDQPGLRAPSPETEYEEWCEMTGQDPSFVGDGAIPGTGDLHEAALRVRAREAHGLVVTIGPVIEPDAPLAYHGMAVLSERGREAVFSGEGVTEDWKDAHRFADHHRYEVQVSASLYDLFDREETLRLDRDGSGRIMIRAEPAGFELDAFEP